MLEASYYYVRIGGEEESCPLVFEELTQKLHMLLPLSFPWQKKKKLSLVITSSCKGSWKIKFLAG